MSTATIPRTRKLGELATTVLRHAKKLPEGGIVSPKEFLHLGTRANVDQVLSRLARKGLLLRIGRGMYTVPLKSRFGIRPPSSRSVIEAISLRTGETIVPSGAVAANALGLSTQIPMRELFLTSGPSRSIKLGRRQVELKHAPHWQVREGVAGAALRALLSMGDEYSEETLNQLWPKLSEAEKKQLKFSRGSGPAWLATAISRQIERDEGESAA
ncbi:MAG: type IV toxin-antitoxin system AbiEi family antitoxin domain-containing protein [Chloroflexi bacterium]|nr:type IV toxin-antitoxin system AbiEi family antitoxin domain-containing protein [Chloroflexota bacterium]MCI0835118.1 type IV toxin-antitoxin system AbiEi family antitoxin domain-containing protein [Chloroflexota bacterium]MCI0852146.1 type IV toxin-antitoxin system AbiEi family antitoxin domain-containing protein [Chloroflexota bacterium]MCI0872482.1 type IV toxin-antitoxin system AbiEi family antitoxin domain-containing protein [Chloroflexota bacterium]